MPLNQESARISAVEIASARNVAQLSEAQYERDVAIRDLVESGAFHLHTAPGPYQIFFAVKGGRIALDVTAQNGDICALTIPLSPFRKLVKDYFLICESHIQATRLVRADQLQTLDMARRGVHNEGAELLQSLLDTKAAMDFNTARRIFTLICILQIA
jgi:uncharacterized protein (UPF0262 family)